MTERQAVVQHFVDKKITFEKPVDMAIYLARDQKQSRPQLVDQSDYVEKVLKAGYTSKMATTLFDDINEAVKNPQPEEAEAEQAE